MDGVFGIESGGDGAAKAFDGRDGGLRGAGDDDVDGRCEGGGASAEEFDAILDTMDCACGSEFAEGDRSGGVNSTLINPVLDPIEIYGGHFKSEAGDQLLENVCLKD